MHMGMHGLFRFLEGENILRRKRVARNRKNWEVADGDRRVLCRWRDTVWGRVCAAIAHTVPRMPPLYLPPFVLPFFSISGHPFPP